jgi:starvation-inducible DNA-binding protein
MAKAKTALAKEKSEEKEPTGTVSTGALSKEISKENHPASQVVAHLQTQVANAFVLYANYKHYHWQTYGPLFRDLHLLFDEFATAVLETADEFAERVRMIGQDPVSGLPAMIEAASVKASSNESNKRKTMREMIEEADTNLLIVIKEMRDAVRIADEQDDPGTADVFTRFVQVHEKHEWWLRDILERRDGLSN